MKTKSPPPDRDGLFVSTRWSLVLEASELGRSSARSLDALSELCRIYWRPLYLFLRRQGHNQDDAQDLTQGFFVDLIETRAYARADKEKGRFRSFLLGALKHFVADMRDRDHAQKRGGGVLPLPLNERVLEEMEIFAARKTADPPEQIYDREWAATLVRQTMSRLENEAAITGKADIFGYLKPFLATPDETAIPYEEIARRSQRLVTTLRSDVARLRARYRTILREEVRGTVAGDDEVDDELRHLCRVLVAA
jgi:DNA-directed RNA polymerase specialized sigma24 family protein